MVSMRLSEAANYLLESLSPFMKKHGFKLNKRSREFIREMDDTKYIFDLFFYKKEDYISVKPEIRIKVEAIEQLYRTITIQENRPHYTLGNHLFEIVRYMDTGNETERGEISNWLIEDKEDLDKLTKIIPEYFEESILLYFNKNGSVARVDELLNKSPREMTIHNWLYPLRANIAIIAAKLNSNPKFNELLAIYDKETLEAEESYRKEFEKLREVLSS